MRNPSQEVGQEERNRLSDGLVGRLPPSSQVSLPTIDLASQNILIAWASTYVALGLCRMESGIVVHDLELLGAAKV
jgi:hypothetical protein